MAPQGKVKQHFVFTISNANFDGCWLVSKKHNGQDVSPYVPHDLTDFLPPGVIGVGWQIELYASGEEHIQGWLVTQNPMTDNDVKKWVSMFGAAAGHIHVEGMRGTVEDNQKYCTKIKSRKVHPIGLNVGMSIVNEEALAAIGDVVRDTPDQQKLNKFMFLEDVLHQCGHDPIAAHMHIAGELSHIREGMQRQGNRVLPQPGDIANLIYCAQKMTQHYQFYGKKQHYQTAKQLKEAAVERKRNGQVIARQPRDVEVWIGSAGTGKSTFLEMGYEDKGLFIKSDASAEWWDGYIPSIHEVVAIDDYNWRKPLDRMSLMALMSSVPVLLPIKHDFVSFNPKKLIIISNYPIEDWFDKWTEKVGNEIVKVAPRLREAFLSRIRMVRKWEGENRRWVSNRETLNTFADEEYI